MNTPFAVSMGFANRPKIYGDHIEVPLDGTVFVSSKGDKRKFERVASEMPGIDTLDPNTMQVFVNEYAIVSALYSLQVAKKTLVLSNSLLQTRVFTVGAFRYFVPEMLEHYDSRQAVELHI